MKDYIKREDAIKICNMPNYNIHDILFALKTIPGKMIPAADVRENVRGEWRKNKVAFYKQCSCCGCDVRSNLAEVFLRDDDDYNFCPNCGADMRGGAKNERCN